MVADGRWWSVGTAARRGVGTIFTMSSNPRGTRTGTERGTKGSVGAAAPTLDPAAIGRTGRTGHSLVRVVYPNAWTSDLCESLTRAGLPRHATDHITVSGYRTAKGGRLHTRRNCTRSRAPLNPATLSLAEYTRAGECAGCSQRSAFMNSEPPLLELARAMRYLTEIQEAATKLRRARDILTWAGSRHGAHLPASASHLDAHTLTTRDIEEGLAAATYLLTLLRQADTFLADLPRLLTQPAAVTAAVTGAARAERRGELRFTRGTPGPGDVSATQQWAQRVIDDGLSAATLCTRENLHHLSLERVAFQRALSAPLPYVDVRSELMSSTQLMHQARTVLLTNLFAAANPSQVEEGALLAACQHVLADQLPNDLSDIPDVTMPAHLAVLPARTAVTALWREISAMTLAFGLIDTLTHYQRGHADESPVSCSSPTRSPDRPGRSRSPSSTRPPPATSASPTSSWAPTISTSTASRSSPAQACRTCSARTRTCCPRTPARPSPAGAST